jgi:hypothetical protein
MPDSSLYHHQSLSEEKAGKLGAPGPAGGAFLISEHSQTVRIEESGSRLRRLETILRS